MAGNIVGLDMGPSGIKIAAATRRGKKITVHKLVHIDLPEGAMNEGVLRESYIPNVSSLLVSAWHEHRLPKRVIMSVFGRGTVANQVTTLPAYPPAVLRKTLPYEVQRRKLLYGDDVDDMAIDFSIIRDAPPNEDGEPQVTAFLAGVKYARMSSMAQAIQGAGITIVGTDIGLLAASRAIHHGVPQQRDVDVLIDMGENGNHYLFHEGGLPQEVTYITKGVGGDLTAHLLSEGAAHGIDDMAEAEKVKCMSRNERPSWANSILSNRFMRGMIAEIANSPAQVIKDFLSIESSTYSSVGTINFIGGASRLDGLMDIAGTELGTLCQRAELNQNIVMKEDNVDPTGYHCFITAIGLAMGKVV